MSGFFAPQADWWRSIRERLPKPWGREEAMTDLRWWQDQVLIGREARVPSYYALAEHWGWGEKKARILMSREEEWGDPDKAERWRAHRGRTEGAPRAHEGLTEGSRDQQQDSAQTVEKAHEGRTEGAPRAHRGRIEGDTRGDPQTPTPTPTPSEEQQAVRLEDQPTVEGPVKARRAKPEPSPSPVRSAATCWRYAWGPDRGVYPWQPAADKRPLTDAAAAAGFVDGLPPDDQRQRLTRAMDLYIRAAENGTAWPPGPPTLRGFGTGVAEWLQRADPPRKLVGKHAHDPAKARPPPPTVTAEERDKQLREWAADEAAEAAAKVAKRAKWLGRAG